MSLLSSKKSNFKKASLKKANVKKSLTTLATSSAIISAGVLSMGTANLASAKAIEPSNADYSFTVEEKYKGTANRSLTKSGNTWKYNVKARVAGVASASQNSTFTLKGNTVTPLTSSTTYKIFGIGRTHNLNFNHAKKQVASAYRGKTVNLSLAQPAFDDLSLEMQIRQDLLNGKFTGNYYMAKHDKIEKTPFRKSGATKITVPAGTFDTVRVDRVHDDNSRSTSFWLAPSLDYLPVKVVQVNDGKKMDLELTKVN